MGVYTVSWLVTGTDKFSVLVAVSMGYPLLTKEPLSYGTQWLHFAWLCLHRYRKKINWRNGNIFLKPSTYLPNTSSFKDPENSNKKSECWVWRGISLVPKTFALSLQRTFLQGKQLCNISIHSYRYIGQWNSTIILHITYHLSWITLWAGRTLCPTRAL